MDPEAVANEFEQVRQKLHEKGYDWTAERKPRGRPTQPLKPGVQLYIERAYASGKPQSRISTATSISPVKIRRHLTSRDLLVRRRTSLELETLLLKAVDRYVKGDAVADILEESKITTADLYRVLRRMKVPLRHNFDKRPS